MKRFLLIAAGALLMASGSIYAQHCDHDHQKAAGSHCAGGSGNCCMHHDEGASISQLKTVTGDELKTMLASNSVKLYDAREKSEFKAGHIKGAVLLTSKNLPANKNATIVIYGCSSNCKEATEAAQKAIKQGYANVLVLKGGYSEWSAS